MIIDNFYPIVLIDKHKAWSLSKDSYQKSYTEEIVKDCLNTIKFIKRN